MLLINYNSEFGSYEALINSSDVIEEFAKKFEVAPEVFYFKVKYLIDYEREEANFIYTEPKKKTL